MKLGSNIDAKLVESNLAAPVYNNALSSGLPTVVGIIPNLNLSCIDIHDIEKEQELELETVQRKMSRTTTREQTSSTS